MKQSYSSLLSLSVKERLLLVKSYFLINTERLKHYNQIVQLQFDYLNNCWNQQINKPVFFDGLTSSVNSKIDEAHAIPQKAVPQILVNMQLVIVHVHKQSSCTNIQRIY